MVTIPPNQVGCIFNGLLILTGSLGLVIWAGHFWLPNLFPYECWQQTPKTALPINGFCPQVEALTRPEHEALLRSLDEEFGSEGFKLKAYESLGGAVRIPTESYGNYLLPSEDLRLDMMLTFHKYLQSRFPKVHANLKCTTVNTYSLLYEWKGSEPVRPLLLTAHMDVVPVNPDTYDDWVYPPFSGYYDGEWIWGRGSFDDKSGVIGSLTAIETLLERGFVPARTVFLAFGHDEEIGGRGGAREIARHLLGSYGPGSLAMLVDEGGKFYDSGGTIFASPEVTEKGYMDIRVDVSTPGGHSSTPPKHTAIGILADLITQLEAHPHQPKLIRGGTYYQILACRAKYDRDFPESLMRLLVEAQTSDEKLQELGDRLVDFDPRYYALSGTTQAVDMIGGGVKVNALPEEAWALVNHRIADHSSPAELRARFTGITSQVAAKHNMTLEAFGKVVGSQDLSWGTIRLADHYSFGPTPAAPTTGSGPYELLSGTIQSTILTRLRTDNLSKPVVVTPSIPTGNTDTRYYSDLTQHIFRYNHQNEYGFQGMHTVNEAIRADSFLEQIRFFTRLILNADRSDSLE